jgi:hypothetical protein
MNIQITKQKIRWRPSELEEAMTSKVYIVTWAGKGKSFSDLISDINLSKIEVGNTTNITKNLQILIWVSALLM